MKTRFGRISGFNGSMGSGIATLVVDLDSGYQAHVPCENATTVRALRAVFGDAIIGRPIEFTVDGLGILYSFTAQEVQ